MRKNIALLFSIATLLVSTAIPASAEWLLDAYIGPAFTQNDKFTNGPAPSATIDYDTAFSFGGRVGHYFEFWPYLGLAFDVSHYQPDGKFGGGGSGFSFDEQVTALSFDALLRLPLLEGKDFPHGQLQPYVTLGPGVYFSHVKIHPTPFFGSSDSDTSAGVKVGAGATWMFNSSIGIFGEYRFSHFSPSLLGFDTDVNTHRLQFGATFRF